MYNIHSSDCLEVDQHPAQTNLHTEWENEIRDSCPQITGEKINRGVENLGSSWHLHYDKLKTGILGYERCYKAGILRCVLQAHLKCTLPRHDENTNYN